MSSPDFKDLLTEKGFKSVRDLAQQAHVSEELVRHLDRGIAKGNNPYYVFIAEKLGIPLEALQPYMKGELPEVQRIRLVSRIANTRTADGKIVRSQKNAAKQARTKRKQKDAPGTALVVTKKRAIATRPATYNKLKALPRESRQMVRGMISQTNIAAMKGDRYVVLPSIPTAELGQFLSDYLDAKGIKGGMLLTPDFADHFDK